MKRLVKWTFCYEERQLTELKELSKKTGVPQAIFVREALGRLLKRYRYATTMKPFTVDEMRYFLAGNRAVGEEELIGHDTGKRADRDRRLQHLFGRKKSRRKKKL